MVQYSYIHIPFCKQKCKYCAFISYVNLSFIDEYIKALIFEIKNTYKNEPQKTVYFGGGTPSILSYGKIGEILNCFKFEKNPEITVEINPENFDREYLKGLFNIGVNRISVGVQAFDDEILKNIGRRHSSKTALKVIDELKNVGFKNVSIDLMYGLPNQTIKKWEYDLKIAKSLDIEHLSTYGLKIEDKTYFAKFPPKNIADEDLQAKMYEILLDEMKHFYHYEISNFAKNENFISKHNINYWNLNPYYGFGASASGFIKNKRYKNQDNLKKYILNPVLKEDEIKLNREDILEEFIFLGFRKFEGVKTLDIKEKFGVDFEVEYKNILEKYEKTGHIEKTKEGFRLTKNGILISNYILCDFIK